MNKIMLRFLVSIIILFYSELLVAQDTLCKFHNYTFKAGEIVTYRAYYNWKFIWLNAGDVLFSVKDTVYQNQESFHFVSKGWSLKEYDWFFKVRDSFESIVAKDGFKPLLFLRDTEEGGFKTYNRYDYNHANNQVNIVSYTSKRAYEADIKSIKPFTFDVLSAIYFCRNIDFNRYKIGDKTPLTMIIDNDVFNLFIRYLGKEDLKLHKDTKTYSTIKFSVMLVEGTIFKGGEDMTIWVTDDANRVPIMVEAKILIGSVKAVITGVEGLVNKSILYNQ